MAKKTKKLDLFSLLPILALLLFGILTLSFQAVVNVLAIIATVLGGLGLISWLVRLIRGMW